jgi:chaperonin cofactor prefoldin
VHKAVESIRSAEFQPKALKSKLATLEEQKEKLNEKLKNIRKKLEKVVYNPSIASANDHC